MVVLVGVRDRPSAAAAVQPFDPFAVSDYDPGVADAGIRLRQPLEPLLLDGVGRRFRHRLFGPAAHAYRGFRNADPACRRLDTDRCFHQPQLHQQGQRGGQRGGRQEREGRRDPQAQSRAARTCGRGGRGCGGCSRTGSETRAEGGRTAARAVESGGTRGAKTRPDPCGTSVGARCGPEVRAGRGRKSLPRTDARRETRRRGDCRGAGAPSRGGRGVHRGGPFASRGPCGDRPQRAGRAGTPCGARRRACGACPGGGSGEGGRTVRSRCALYRDHRAGRCARRGAGGRRGDGRGQRGETSRREGDPHGELRPAEGPGELPQAARDAPGGLHFRFGGLATRRFSRTRPRSRIRSRTSAFPSSASRPRWVPR